MKTKTNLISQKQHTAIQNIDKDLYGIFSNKSSFLSSIDTYKSSGVVDKDSPAYKFIVNSLPDKIDKFIKEKFPEYADYIMCTGSTGQTKVSSSFWVACLDSRITTTTRKNSYVVTLFNDNCTRMYTCIAFGIEDIPSGYTPRKYLKESISTARIKIGKLAKSMGFKVDDNANLNAKTNRSKLYEKSIVAYKEYSIFDVTENQFLEDLENMLKLYYLYQFEYVLDQENESSEIVQSESTSKGSRKISTQKHQQLIQQQQLHNKETGTAAEKYVFEQERLNLQRNGREDLVDKVKWVSNPKNGYDGLYDIHSVYPDGRPKRIEVKGTSLNTNGDFKFYMSSNEVKVAELYANEYILTLVDNVGDPKNIRIVDEISAPLNKINTEPTQFRCIYKSKKTDN